MLDPWEGIPNFREGDGDVSQTPTGGPYGSPAYTDYQAPDQDNLPGIYKRWELVTLTPGTDPQKFDAGDLPTRWIVISTADANQITRIWPESAPGGAAHRIGVLGRAKIPGRSQFLWLQAAGAANSIVHVVALRGYDDLDIAYGS